MTTLTLVRHGETDWNAQGRIQGSSDIPLNDTGRTQARQAAVALRDTVHEGPVVVACSDMSRARETAEIIAAGFDLAEVRSYPQLRERGYGQAEGVTDTEFFERWGPWHTAEVPGAEPWHRVRARALEGLRRAVRDARRHTRPVSPSLVIVAHGGIIRTLIGHATGGSLPLHGERLPNGSAHTFLMERDRLRLLSYSAHTA